MSCNHVSGPGMLYGPCPTCGWSDTDGIDWIENRFWDEQSADRTMRTALGDALGSKGYAQRGLARVLWVDAEGREHEGGVPLGYVRARERRALAVWHAPQNKDGERA